MPSTSTKVPFLNSTVRLEKGERVCIIADNSGSMVGEPLALVKRELTTRTLPSFKPEIEFYLMFFNTQDEPMPSEGWLKGTPENVARISYWVRGKPAHGLTFPLSAFARAFKLDPRPDVILFMTDGVIPDNVPAAVAQMNRGKTKVKINTIMFTSDPTIAPNFIMRALAQAELLQAVQRLRIIAENSGGTYRLYTPWSPEDLAKAAEAGDAKRLAIALNYIPQMLREEVREVIPRLLTSLHKAPPEARSLIILVLRMIGPMEPSHLRALIALLRETDESLLLFSLGALTSLHSDAREAVTHLCALFNSSENQRVLLATIKALEQIAKFDPSVIALYRDHGLKKKLLPVRLASLKALHDLGGEALSFRLLVSLSFDDADDNMRRAAQDYVRERMQAASEKDLPEVQTLLAMKAHVEAVELGLAGVARLGPKAMSCLGEVLDGFLKDEDRICKASVPALRALGKAASSAVEPLMARLPSVSPTRQMEIALILAALNPTDAKVAQSITPLLVRNLHPKSLPKDGPPEMLLDAIKSMGAATVPLIFKDLEEATGKLGGDAADHRKYLFLALQRLGNLAYSEQNLRQVTSYTLPKAETYSDVRIAAGKARMAMTPAAVKQADSPGERNLVLSILEDLYGSTWPDAATVGDARTVKSFIARRKRVLNDLKSRFKEVQLGGEHSPALLELLERYEMVLDKGQKHAEKLDTFEEEVKKKWLEMFTKVSQEDPRKRLEMAGHVASNAADYFAKPPADPFADLFAALSNYPNADENKLQTMQEQVATEWKAYFAKANLEYQQKARPLAELLVAEVRRDLEEQRKAEEKLKELLTQRNNAKPSGSLGAALLDDLLSQMRALERAAIDTTASESARIAQHLERSDKYKKLALALPKSEAYHFLRAVCYAQAGKDANRACDLEAISKGFLARKVKAGGVAGDAWKNYLNYEKSDCELDGSALHEVALADAYTGNYVKGYLLIKKYRRFWPANAGFYYDFARLSCVVAETPVRGSAAQRTLFKSNRLNAPDVLRDSSAALESAVRLGFEDFERANRTPDLDALRKADARLLGRARTYNQILGRR